MNIKMNEGKRQIIIKAWRGLSDSLASGNDKTLEIIKHDIDQLIEDLEHTDLSDGVFYLTQIQQDNFTHAYSYLGNRWELQNFLTDAEFVIYDKFEDEIF